MPTRRKLAVLAYMPRAIVGSVMIKGRVVGFNSKTMADTMMKTVVDEQNRRFIEYAKEEVGKIGNRIREYHSANNMDRTGNLLDSLCWGVSYAGKLVEGGFYRNAQASRTSYLHEWFSGDVKYLIPVSGHQLADEYINKYGNNGAQGWRVFFAILAPYWGYWEKGFNMKSGGGVMRVGSKTFKIPQTSRFLQFAVMTQFYDEIKSDLKPARVRFRSSVAKYERQRLEKKWERISGI